MTLDPWDLVPIHQTVYEIFIFKVFLENGRFDLKNVGQGQIAIHHFSWKNKRKKVPLKKFKIFQN